MSKKSSRKAGLFCEEMVKRERVREDAGARKTRTREGLHSGPSVDPVVLVKMVLIQHLYGLPSLRGICMDP